MTQRPSGPIFVPNNPGGGFPGDGGGGGGDITCNSAGCGCPPPHPPVWKPYSGTVWKNSGGVARNSGDECINVDCSDRNLYSFIDTIDVNVTIKSADGTTCPLIFRSSVAWYSYGRNYNVEYRNGQSSGDGDIIPAGLVWPWIRVSSDVGGATILVEATYEPTMGMDLSQKREIAATFILDEISSELWKENILYCCVGAIDFEKHY